jgi:hypothetical protein
MRPGVLRGDLIDWTTTGCPGAAKRVTSDHAIALRPRGRPPRPGAGPNDAVGIPARFTWQPWGGPRSPSDSPGDGRTRSVRLEVRASALLADQPAAAPGLSPGVLADRGGPGAAGHVPVLLEGSEDDPSSPANHTNVTLFIGQVYQAIDFVAALNIPTAAFC